jgi:hypothetical protein
MVHNDAVKIEFHELAVDVKGSSEGFSSRKKNVERRRAEWPPFPFEWLIDPAIWQMREIVLLNMNLVSGIRPGIVEGYHSACNPRALMRSNNPFNSWGSMNSKVVTILPADASV